jgi:hypothetical protein
MIRSLGGVLLADKKSPGLSFGREPIPERWRLGCLWRKRGSLLRGLAGASAVSGLRPSRRSLPQYKEFPKAISMLYHASVCPMLPTAADRVRLG